MEPAETFCGIRTALKKKVVKSLSEVPGEWKVLILDNAAAQVLSSGMKVHDIMEFGITLIEDLSKSRQPLPRSPAVYFISPTEASLDRLIADWTNPKCPQPYASAHILFTNRISDETLQKISHSAVGPHLKTLKEVLVEFTAVDRFAFKINTTQDLFKFFCNNDQRDVQRACSYVASFLHTMGETPTIRFFNTSTCRTFAFQLLETIELLGHLDRNYTEACSSSGGSVMLILDRSVDCCGPLMHELTYNCFLQDVYPLEGMKYRHTVKAKDGTNTEKDMLLDDHDPVWMKLHHLHIADASKEVDKAFAEFREANAALALTGKSGREVTNAQLSDAVHAMPQMQEKMSRFSMHMDILRKLNILFRDGALEPCIALEQRMATGEMEDGTKTSTKDIEADLQRLLRDTSYTPETKTRLLLLFVMTQGLPTAAKREQLIQMAQLGSAEDSYIDKLAALGVKLTTEKKFFGKKRPKRMGAVKEGAYDLSRYESAIKVIVESLAKDTLSNTEYPFVKEPPSSNKASTSAAAGRTLRAGATWSTSLGVKGAGASAPKGNERHCDIGGGAPIVSVNGQRLFVFIVGGVSNAEVRGAQEVMLETKREIYIGGTSLTTASDFVQQLGMLNSAT